MNNELKKRIFTGTMGSAAIVLLLLFAQWFGLLCITLVISIGMIIEFSNMAFRLPDFLEKRYFLLILVWFMLLLSLFFPKAEWTLLVISFQILFLYFLVSAYRHVDGKLLIHFQELAFSIFGLIYLFFIPFYFLKIYNLSQGQTWIFLFFCIVWSGDIAAYFVGKRWGRTQLYQKVSPKKTWEGAIASFFSSIVVALVFRFFFSLGISMFSTVLLAGMVSLTAQLGDLCESFLKRAFDKKDSGFILPGHGGFLDRFDSIIFSLPIMYFGVQFFT